MAENLRQDNDIKPGFKLSSFQRNDHLAKALGYKSYSDLAHSTKFRAQGDNLNEDASVYTLLSNKNNQRAIIKYYAATFQSKFELEYRNLLEAEARIESYLATELYRQSLRENFILKKVKLTQAHRDILNTRGVPHSKASYLYSFTKQPLADEATLEYFKDKDHRSAYFSERCLQVKILHKDTDFQPLELGFMLFYFPDKSNLGIEMSAEDSDGKKGRAMIASFIKMDDGDYVFCDDYEGLRPFLYVKKMEWDLAYMISIDIDSFRGEAKQLAKRFALKEESELTIAPLLTRLDNQCESSEV